MIFTNFIIIDKKLADDKIQIKCAV